MKLSIRAIHVSTRFGKASGKALATNMKNVNPIIPAPRITPIYFKGYFPMNTNIITIENIKAAVEKLAGRIKIIVIKTGVHNSQIEFWNVMGVSLFLDK